MPHVDDPVPARQFGRYVLGRPLMFVLWGIALWGTAAGVRLVWMAATQGLSAALPLLGLPSVFVPIVLAVLMWGAVAVAVRRFRGDGEP
ncbi:MAG TPA: hypothetical protein VMR21_04560 [Vicinamibacteria bacterium]|nr:hypothetical protein [Vicinamibacteria bacterium]